ncbi:hypothetical protein DPMN_184374 [Dreissena polymorpha]|uniref:Uncharacterized protein n=1 Tax=Dreissena polymorpha TaxID=45954 RepID=A0A9D4I6D2_DREPO|nr:hypothetical protein DPMN_184374 [Dreissena polymorpha]
MKISSDSKQCNITAICCFPDGQILVADLSNKNVKLLDQQYQVVSHCSVTTRPLDVCPITPSEVAVVGDDKIIHEVQFITVKNRQLLIERKLQLQHICGGIACHQEDLYITSNAALYKHTMSGKLVSKMYEDTSGLFTGSNHS